MTPPEPVTLTTMDALQADVWDWINTTFEPRGRPRSFALKAAEEIAELAESGSPEEAADAVIALLAYCACIGVSLADRIVQKMQVNRARTWTQDEHGIAHHVEDGPS
jgi:hypothetical protein